MTQQDGIRERSATERAAAAPTRARDGARGLTTTHGPSTGDGPVTDRLATADQVPPLKVRDQFIPVRKIDILEALVKEATGARPEDLEKFRQVCRLLGAVYHYEYFDRLEKLRHAYFYFNPERKGKASPAPAVLDKAYDELMNAFIGVLKGANFIEVPQHEIERAHRESVLVQVELEAPLEDFREVHFFRRGQHRETFTLRRWFGLRKEAIEATVYDDVVMLVAMKSEAELAANGTRRHQGRNKTRPGCILIKYFRDIASADLNALFPNVRIVMSTFDKLFLGIPAIAGCLPILFKLWSTVTVLFLVIGFYLGLASKIDDDQLTQALAALGGFIALGGLGMRQWVKYQRQSLKYQVEITDNIYYRNVNNNSGIFDYIIGAAEEQECKEAFLAYYFLSTAAAPLTQPELDARIERWLKDAFDVDVDFEVDDALIKLERLKLLKRNGDALSVLPPDKCLAQLDFVWDNYFQFNAAPVERMTANA
jgi:hypothetical protein